MEEQVIRLDELIEALKKRWLMILSIVLISTVISIVFNFFIIKPKYEVNTKVFIGKEESDNQGYNQNDVLMYQKLMKTYSEAIKTKDLVSKSLSKIDSDLEVSDVLNNLTVETIVDTQILKIKYRSNYTEEAMDIVKAISEEFIKTSKELVPNGKVKIIEEAELPKSPISPNKTMNIAIGFLIGIMVGISLAFILEFLDNTFKNKEQLARELELPVVGLILKVIKENIFIVEKDPKSIAAERYKVLRTNIQYSSFDKKCKVIVITSSEASEGKSVISGNLSLCMAQEEKKVILIDCDLRKASLHKKFGIPNLFGLSDVVAGKMDLHEVIYRYNENLAILTSGNIPPNPSEMLSSKAFERLLNTLRESFDYIILDTPPILAVTDSQILSTKADGTILVVKAEKTKRDTVRDAVGYLKQVNTNIIGTVLNMVDIKRDNKYYYYNEKE